MKTKLIAFGLLLMSSSAAFASTGTLADCCQGLACCVGLPCCG